MMILNEYVEEKYSLSNHIYGLLSTTIARIYSCKSFDEIPSKSKDITVSDIEVPIHAKFIGELNYSYLFSLYTKSIDINLRNIFKKYDKDYTIRLVCSIKEGRNQYIPGFMSNNNKAVYINFKGARKDFKLDDTITQAVIEKIKEGGPQAATNNIEMMVPAINGNIISKNKVQNSTSIELDMSSSGNSLMHELTHFMQYEYSDISNIKAPEWEQEAEISALCNTAFMTFKSIKLLLTSIRAEAMDNNNNRSKLIDAYSLGNSILGSYDENKVYRLMLYMAKDKAYKFDNEEARTLIKKYSDKLYERLTNGGYIPSIKTNSTLPAEYILTDLKKDLTALRRL